VIDVEDWAEIRRLHRAEGLSIKAIVRRTGQAHNTVRDALRSGAPPRPANRTVVSYASVPRGSSPAKRSRSSTTTTNAP
jgi:hypothetical protein